MSFPCSASSLVFLLFLRLLVRLPLSLPVFIVLHPASPIRDHRHRPIPMTRKNSTRILLLFHIQEKKNSTTSGTSSRLVKRSRRSPRLRSMAWFNMLLAGCVVLLPRFLIPRWSRVSTSSLVPLLRSRAEIVELAVMLGSWDGQDYASIIASMSP
jgi:hypothetical protein